MTDTDSAYDRFMTLETDDEFTTPSGDWIVESVGDDPRNCARVITAARSGAEHEWARFTASGAGVLTVEIHDDETPDGRTQSVSRINIYSRSEPEADSADEVADDTESATDGGEDHSDILTDRQIESAIDQHDDPDHEDAHTVAEIRASFAAVQRDLADSLETLDDFSEVAYEDKAVVIYVDEDGSELERAMDAAGLEDDDILESILSNLMHAAARERSDYEWPSAYPLVVRKPLALRRGERHALARIGQTSRDLGGLPQGADWYACQIRGWGQRKWSEYTGRSHGAAGKNVREVRRKN